VPDNREKIAKNKRKERARLITSPPALQLYTVREQLATDRLGVLRHIAGSGYGAVEPYDVLTDPDQLRADLDEAGLAVCAVHAKVLGEDSGALLRGTRTVGADTVIVPWMEPAIFASADGVAGLARELNEAAVTAADHGLRLGYHNHDFELSARIGGRPALEVLADALDPAVILEVDTYWAAVGGLTPDPREGSETGGDGGRGASDAEGSPPGEFVPALLGRLGDRVRYLHVKDGPVTKDDPMTAVGAGRMPVAEILAACPSAQWHVVELDRCATDMLTAVDESLAWLAAHGLAKPVAR
jgi:sugar phosphate isomerase/epimerase